MVEFYHSLGPFLNDLSMRFTGPMRFRFILQPAVAIALGIRDGLNDARVGRAAYIYDLIVRPEGRRQQIKGAWAALVKPITVAIVLDAIAQYLMLGVVYPGAAVLVGTCVMGIPYILARGIMNRVASARQARRARGQSTAG